MKCLLIVALATLQVIAGQEDSCGDSWSLYEAENKCIRAFGKVKDSWPGAETACEREGGRIVTIHNKEAHAFVDKLVRDDGSVFWIGLTRTPKDANWVWQDGTTLGEYHAWAKGEPNNALTYEDCVQRYSTGSWNDNDCNVRNSYICEKEGPGCKRNNGGCSADAICVDPADGGWHVTCRCHHGYALEDGHCYDFNECSFNNGGCDDICTNNDGSFACSCREGYVAVGKTCTQDTIVG